jgi:protein TonB
MKAVYAIPGMAVQSSLPSSFTDELKNTYQKYLKRGFIYAVIIHCAIIAAYGGILYYKYIAEEESKIKQQRVINVTLTDLEPPPSLTEEEPPPRIEEKLTMPVKDLEAMTPEPVAKEKAEVQTIKTQKELEEIKTPVSTVGDTGTFMYSGNIKIDEKKIETKIETEKTEIKEKEKTVYQQFEVEKPPECVNLGQVKESMKYPDVAREGGIEGKVVVKVLVDESGSVIKIGSISGEPVFHDEVKDKAMNLHFTPGLQNGKPVKVWVSVPFVFRLKN